MKRRKMITPSRTPTKKIESKRNSWSLCGVSVLRSGDGRVHTAHSKLPFFSAPARSTPGDHAKAQTPLIILTNYKRRQDIVSIMGTCSLRPNYRIRDVHIFALFVCPNSCSIPQDFDVTVPLTNSPPHCEVQSHSEGRKPDFP